MVHDLPTQDGGGAPTAVEARPAVAQATAPAEAPARRRLPRRARKDDARAKRPRRGRRALVALAGTLIVLVPVAIGAYLASQAVYFIGTTPDGFVAMYRGLPYDLPAGIDLYSTNYISGVPVNEVPAARRATLLDHQLRSHDDAADLVRELEQGRLTAR